MWFNLVLLMVIERFWFVAFDHEQEHEHDYGKAKRVAFPIICFIFAPL